MRVAVDVRSMMDRPTGIGVFGVQCLERMLEQGHDVIAYSFGGRRPSAALSQLSARLRGLVHHPVPMRAMRTLWRAPVGPRLEAFTGAVDVVFATEATLPRADAPLVSVLHDALFLRHPEWFPRYVRVAGPQIVADIERRATVLVHSSDTTRSTLASDRPRLRGRGVIVPPAVTVSAAWSGAGRRDVLFVGTREPRKGLGTVARALLRTSLDARLVVVGKLGWGTLPGADALSLLERQGRLAVEGFVSAPQLRRLRESAALAVVPSLDEGFGLPLLEALAAGLPVIASDIPVFREVAAEACSYVDPQAVDAWADEIERLFDDAGARAALSRAALERAAEFTVPRQAQALEAALQRARAAA